MLRERCKQKIQSLEKSIGLALDAWLMLWKLAWAATTGRGGSNMSAEDTLSWASGVISDI